jgi:small conductance mechanosensitive channel
VGVVLSLALLVASPLAAQETSSPAAASPGPASAPAAAANGAAGEGEFPEDGAAPAEEAVPPAARDAVEQLDPATVDRVISVLENEVERQRLLDTLRAVTAVEDAAEPDAPPAVVAEPVGWLQAEIDERVAAVQASVDAILQSGSRVEHLGRWLTRQVLEPGRRIFWLQTLTQIGLVLGVALAAALVPRRWLRRARTHFERYAPPTPFHFTGAVVLHALLRLVPIGLFVVAAAAVAVVLDLGAYTAAVTRSLVEGLAFVTAVTAVMRAVLNVRNPHMRLFPVEESVGLDIQRSILRAVAVGGYGYFALQAARALGLPWTVHGFLEHVLFFVTFLLYLRLVLRFRGRGADGLRALAAEGRGGVVSRFLPWDSVARTWHVVAILFGLAVYGSWALEIAGGPAFLFRALGITLVLLFITRLVNVWLTSRALDRAPERSGQEEDEEDEPEPGNVLITATRSPLHFLLRLATTALALVLILQAWGVDVWGWSQSEAGEAVRDAILAALATLAVAYLIWRLVNRLIGNAIEETDNLGRPVRSSRSQTLLSIGRNVGFAVIWLTAGMLALSELGVNLAPLIAGAGVIGLAIGFGAQTLVQDIITGFFILLEDTIAVGDVADLGGKVGVVEAVTLRIVRLRGYDGQVHTIPYSKIATISNLTKDFSYYVFDVGVSYKEDVDRVMAVMAEVGAQMQRDRAYRRLIVEPLEVAGVDRFAENAVVIRARMKTRPLQQWTIGREYNRRLKNRFDELGIEIPFPQRTLHLATPAAMPAFPAPVLATGGSGAPDGMAENVAETR